MRAILEGILSGFAILFVFLKWSAVIAVFACLAFAFYRLGLYLKARAEGKGLPIAGQVNPEFIKAEHKTV